jgi:hypothetical protein
VSSTAAADAKPNAGNQAPSAGSPPENVMKFAGLENGKMKLAAFATKAQA